MGWLYQHEPLRHETPCQYFARTNTLDTETQRIETLAASAVRGVIYGAVRVTEKPTDRSYVLCVVWLYKNNRRAGFGYKSMDETMGPVDCDAPPRIMALLSPVADIPEAGYAAEWRQRVAERAADRTRASHVRHRLRLGDQLTLPRPVRFRGGFEADAFRVIEVRPRRSPILEPLNVPGLRCRLTRALLSAAILRPLGSTAP
jgi:hypothetical protein